MHQIPPPSQLNGRNIGHSARRMRRVGRLSPKQYHNLTGRRVFALSSDGISLCRNHVEQEQLVCKTAAADSLLRQRSAYLYTACGKFYNSILKFVFFHASALLQSHNSTISYFHNFTISQFITVVKIEPINIDVCSHFHKMLRPRPSRIGASPRIGRASRSDMNRLTGSIGIVSNFVAGRRGAKFANWSNERSE